MKTKTNHLLVKQPLQIEALLAAVRRRTGLDDFGDETFREPPESAARVLRKRGTPEHYGQMRFNSGHSATPYQSVAYSARPRTMAMDRGGSDYRAAVYNGTAAHRDRTSSESGGDSVVSWTLAKNP